MTTDTSVRTDVTGSAGFRGFSACKIVTSLEKSLKPNAFLA